MAFKTDKGGTAFKCNDIKIFSGSSTWNTRLSQLSKMKGEICITTYSLPKLEYIDKILSKRPNNIRIICHSKFKDKALIIKRKYPDIHIGTLDNIHSKLVLAEPNTVHFSSANFGSSGWIEHCIGLHSKQAFDICIIDFNKMWNNSLKIRGEK